MTINKFKKLEQAIDDEDSFLLSFDLVRLKKLYKLLTIIYHRNKNQHNMSLYFKHVKSLRKYLYNIVVEADIKKSSSIQIYNIMKYTSKFNKNIIKKMIYDFYNVINGKTFINLAITMITVIAEIYNLIFVDYINKIDEYLKTNKNLEIVRFKNKIRIMSIKDKKVSQTLLDKKTKDIIENHSDLNALVNTSNDDLGEEIFYEELNEQLNQDESSQNLMNENDEKKQVLTITAETDNNINKKTKKEKLKKKKKSKSRIDDIFGDF
ncbi:hypothetical protein QEN19_001866 [Hanseniaspora menglaensis]